MEISRMELKTHYCDSVVHSSSFFSALISIDFYLLFAPDLTYFFSNIAFQKARKNDAFTLIKYCQWWKVRREKIKFWRQNHYRDYEERYFNLFEIYSRKREIIFFYMLQSPACIVHVKRGVISEILLAELKDRRVCTPDIVRIPIRTLAYDIPGW